MSQVRIKICGLTREEDVENALALGVELLGINFVPASPRCVSVERARELVRLVRGRCETVAVVADKSLSELSELLVATGIDSLQLHGSETPDVLRSLLADQTARTHYKALRIAAASDVALAHSYPGTRILVDAKVPGLLGGSGHAFDWSLVLNLARERQMLLAGGLTPDNVQRAVAEVGPWAVDCASGVESAPGVKDAELMRCFVANARSARVLPA